MNSYNEIDEAIKPNLDSEELRQIVEEVESKENYECFHLHDQKGQVVGVFDSNIANYLKNRGDIFFVKDTPYIYDGGVYERDNNGAVLMSMIGRYIYPRFRKISTIKRVYGLLAIEGINKDIDELNRYPPECVVFKNGIYNAKTREMDKHQYYFCAVNQIPFEFYPDKKPECPTVQRWLDETLSPAEKEMFLEYAGYCMTTDTRQQKFLMFTGEGGTGKSLFINLLAYAVGSKNTSSINLRSLAENRFASFNLFQKLLNQCADIDKSSLSDVANIKLLTGGDVITGEAKGKEPIFFRSYAKLLFSANEIPRIKDEHTGAFYRRLLVIPLNKKPKSVNPNLLEELKKEIDGFIYLCMEALYRMYQRGEILESEQSKTETYTLRMYSDSVEAFLFEKTEKKENGKISGKELHEAYKKYCEENELKPVLKQNFFKACDSKGYSHADKRNIKGLIWKATDFETADGEEIPFD